jgi:hypothetical protein
MSWLLSIVVGILTAVIGAIATGTIAALAADWYRIPSREGASGYFVLGFILLAIIVGFLVGIGVSRMVAARPDPGFLKAFGFAQFTMLGAVGIIGGIARLRADVGPTLGGKDLILNVEFRWPRGQEPPAATEQWWLELASVSSRIQRNSQDGPAWRADARLEDGYWIVPGAVNLYTSRGDRVITLRPDGILPMGYVANVPAWPGRKSLEWSEWYPQQKGGGPPPPNEFRFRHRLVRAGEPIRTQTVGAFEVDTRAQSVGSVTYQGHPRTWTAYGTFSLRYRGQPLVVEGRKLTGETPGRYEEVSEVAVIPGEQPALLVMVNATQGHGEIMLLAPEGDSVRTEYISQGPGLEMAPPLTNDLDVFQRIASRSAAPGQVDTVGFSHPGLYLFTDALLDTRTRTVRRFTAERLSHLIDRINPLAISPDEKSFVRLAYHPDLSDRTIFEVINTATGEHYQVPIDKYQMRFGEYDDLSPLHVAHYFTWVRDKGGDDRLVAREKGRPLPYRGRTTVEPDYQEYRVHLAKASLRPAVIEWLATEFRGEAQPQEGLSDYSREVKIDGKIVNVSYSDDDGHVGIWMDRGPDVGLVSTIGNRLNEALATGKFDQHFQATEPTASPADSTE